MTPQATTIDDYIGLLGPEHTKNEAGALHTKEEFVKEHIKKLRGLVTIVYAEDQANVRMLVPAILKMHGYKKENIQTFAYSSEAITFLEEQAAQQGESFTKNVIVLTDNEFEYEGRNEPRGTVVATTACDAGIPKERVTIYTANSRKITDVYKNEEDLPCGRVYQKPFNNVELVKAIETGLTRQLKETYEQLVVE